MSRQPFLPRYKGKHFCFDSRGLEADDALSALVGQCVAEWTRTEHVLAMILAAMLGGAPTAGVALFTTLRNARAQRDAIKAVGRTALDSAVVEILEALLGVFQSVGKLRNDLAHGMLGWSFDIPGALLWAEQANISDREARSWVSGTFTINDSYENVIFIYRREDLAETLESIKTLHQDAFHLYVIIRHGYDCGHPLWTTLCSSPRVAQELGRLRQDTQSVVQAPNKLL